jgi:hypothetical protein
MPIWRMSGICRISNSTRAQAQTHALAHKHTHTHTHTHSCIQAHARALSHREICNTFLSTVKIFL